MDAFIGEIRLLPYNYAPQGWAWCWGTQLSIQQNTVLYAVIGPRYGGDQKTYFNLPDMRGTVPIGMGTGPGLTPSPLTKTVAGDNSVTINAAQTGVHTHSVTAKFVAGKAGLAAASLLDKPANDSWLSRAVLATSSVSSYVPAGATPDTTFPAQTISPGGGAAAPAGHENRQPYLPVNFCICLDGTYPPNPNN